MGFVCRGEKHAKEPVGEKVELKAVELRMSWPSLHVR